MLTGNAMRCLHNKLNAFRTPHALRFQRCQRALIGTAGSAARRLPISMSLAKRATADAHLLFGEPSCCKAHPCMHTSPLWTWRARQFYEQKLGLKAKQEINGGVVFEFGKGTGCFMYPTPNAGTSKSSQAFWTVDDIAREVADLKKRGVQ